MMNQVSDSIPEWFQFKNGEIIVDYRRLDRIDIQIREDFHAGEFGGEKGSFRIEQGQGHKVLYRRKSEATFVVYASVLDSIPYVNGYSRDLTSKEVQDLFDELGIDYEDTEN